MGDGRLKEIYFDVETSGTDDKVNGILQLAGRIECDGLEPYAFNYFMKPFPDQIIEDGALEVNGITRSQIESFADPFECYIKFTRVLNQYVDRFDKSDKFTLIGYNSRFDDDFMREWFKRCHDKYYGSFFFWPAIDVANMCAVKYRKIRSQFENFKLMTVAAKVGIDIEEDRSHEAMYDVMVTRELYKKCIAC